MNGIQRSRRSLQPVVLASAEFLGTFGPAVTAILRVAVELASVRWRFGPAFGVKFPDTQFPVEAVEQLA